MNRTVEPPKPIAFLTYSDQQESISNIQGKLQAIAFDQDVYGVWVYNPQSKYKTWIPEASQNRHLLCNTKSNEMYINIISWQLKMSKIEIRYDNKQNELVYNGRILPRSYKDEYSEPTAQFPASTMTTVSFFSHQFEAKMNKRRTDKG